MPRFRAPHRRAVVALFVFALTALGMALSCARGAAHPAKFAAATAKILPDRAFTVQVRFDFLAFVLDDTPFRIGDAPMNALLDGPADALQSHLTEAAQRFQTDFQVSGGAVDTIAFPTVADIDAWRDSGVKPRLPVMQTVTISGHLNTGAKTVAFRFPEVLGMVVLTTEVPYQEPVSEPLDAGALSAPVDVTPGAPPVAAAPVAAAPPSAPATSNSNPLQANAAPAPKQRPTDQAQIRRDGPANERPTTERPANEFAPTSTAVHLRGLQSLRHTSNASAMVKSEPRGRATVLVGANSFAGLPHAAPPVKSAPNKAAPNTSLDAGAPNPTPLGDNFKFATSIGAPTKAAVANPPMTIAKPSAAIAAVSAITSATRERSIPAAPRSRSWFKNFLGFVKMGYTHILPEGLDHILFVLGLFLLSTKLKPLLWQITAFTVAHSLTLGLALYGVVRLPSSIIEPIIAASIAFVAVENICTAELKPWRPFVVFAFGLVHGMGFAGALKDLGLHRPDFLTALVGFNVGVEMGQLSVVALAFLCVGWLRSRANYRTVVVVPASALIAAIAVFWTIQRTL